MGMTDIFMVDEVNLIPVTFDSYGSTEGTAVSSKAYVEDNSREIYGADGQMVRADYLVKLPATVTIDRNTLVEITKRKGATQVNTVKRKIKRIDATGGFTHKEYEVYV